jgi:hypothetical protein
MLDLFLYDARNKVIDCFQREDRIFLPLTSHAMLVRPSRVAPGIGGGIYVEYKCHPDIFVFAQRGQLGDVFAQLVAARREKNEDGVYYKMIVYPIRGNVRLKLLLDALEQGLEVFEFLLYFYDEEVIPYEILDDFLNLLWGEVERK